MMAPCKQSLLAVLVLMFASNSALAEGFVAGAVSAPTKGSATNFRKAASFAILLGQLADKKQDAVLMLAALKIKNEIGMQVLNIQKELTGGVPVNSIASGESVDTATSDVVKVPFDPSTAGMASRAQKYVTVAEKLNGIATLIDTFDVLARGRLEGPSEHADVVRQGQTDSYKMTFKGGERAYIAIIGDGDSNLNLSVYDEKNKLVCKSATRSDEAACEVFPRKQSQFTIRVSNLGSVSNRYHLLTN